MVTAHGKARRPTGKHESEGMSMGSAKKSKARKKPWEPPTSWDMGPNTAAQRARKVVESADWIDPETGERRNPNGVKRARRISMVELLFRRGKITRRQFSAGEALLYAWERNEMTPPAIRKVQVDCTTKPDAHIAIMIDRISGYTWLTAKLPARQESLILHVCRDDMSITEFPGYRRGATIAQLQIGLDALADRIGL